MRRLDPQEVVRRLAAGRARAARIAQQSTRRPASELLRQAIQRAEAALALVVSDVESTTTVREGGNILRYDDWVAESAQDPVSWVLHGGEDEGG